MSSLDKHKRIVDDTAEVLSRDVETLYEMYKPLRKSLYRDFQAYLPNEASKEDLVSFINEQFVRLCYEYDVAGEVDFAGYIKAMLTLRVKHSFISKEYKMRTKEPLGDEDDIRLTAHIGEESEDEYEQLRSELLNTIYTNASLSDLDKEIIEGILSEKSMGRIEAELYVKHRGTHTKARIKREVADVVEYLRVSIGDWLKK